MSMVFFVLITISSICFRMRYRIMISLVPFSISYLYDFLFPLTVAQVKYKADLKKLHKPVTDMKESLIMNHVLNTSHLASSVSAIVCSKNSLLLPCTAKFLLWGHMHLLLRYWKHVCPLQRERHHDGDAVAESIRRDPRPALPAAADKAPDSASPPWGQRSARAWPS